ncbi:ADP-ribosylation factor-like protein 9, partial [Galemys pyrenaicus]
TQAYLLHCAPPPDLANPLGSHRTGWPASTRCQAAAGVATWLTAGAVTACVVYAAWAYVSRLRPPQVTYLPGPWTAVPARGRAGGRENARAKEMDKGKLKKKEKGKEPEKVREKGKEEKRKEVENEKLKGKEKEKGKEEKSKSKEEKSKEREPKKEKEQFKGQEKEKNILTKPLLEPPDKDKQILVLGLDGAGKTSVLHSLALNRVQHSVAPTQGFNEVCIHTEDSQMVFLEIGGSEPFRPYWEMYLSKGLLLIFVVDSADHNRLPEAKKHLHQLIGTNPILPLVVFANKQDLETAYRITDIHEALALSEVGNNRKMFLFGTQVTQNGSEIPSTMQDAKDLIAHLAADIQRAGPPALCGLAS